MDFRPQPYPLFFACIEDGAFVSTGQVIGWQMLEGDDLGSIHVVVLYDRDDSSSSGPLYLRPDEDPSWIGANKVELRKRAELALKDKRVNR